MGHQWSTKEEILLASEPRDIRLQLQSRAENASFFDPISKEAEAEIIAMGNRLLDLTLAQYCLHFETAQSLFNRDRDDLNIRYLVLSNKALHRASLISTFPEGLFGSDEALVEYLGEITADERASLFSNSTLDDTFLEAFLSLGPPWLAMDRDQRLWALSNLAANPKLRRNRETADYEDGYLWYLAGKPFEAAWKLIEKLPPNVENAKHLSLLLRELPADCHNIEGIKASLSLWEDRDVDGKETAKENAKGRLSPCQLVRQAGARLLAGNHEENWEEYLASEDVAIRCGAYEAARKIDRALIHSAAEKDGDLARIHLTRNPNLWRTSELRMGLLYEARKDAETEEPHWEFMARERLMREQFPAWFEGDEFFEVDEKSIAEGSITELARAVASTPELGELKVRLASLEKTQQMLFWMLLVILVATVSMVWR